VVHI